ncbi:hypothetical protein ATCC90586_007699 [Pythium insidiosum]|nr:hypothetical protein ATCC90586_007699 [Pythium insidiosum]
MQLTITSADGDRVAQVDADPQQRVADITLQLQQQFNIPAAEQLLLLNGNPVRLDTSFEAAGIRPDDLLVIMRNPQGVAAQAPPMHAPPPRAAFAPGSVQTGMRLNDIPSNATPELLLEIMEKNPHLLPELEATNPKLAQALRTRNVSLMALEQNPFDAAAQAKIEERIRLSNVQKNMEIAIEEMPEAFARVYMLYIPCEVNGVPVKAFVDSGAQSTIMSSAVGVGTAKIIGRVHMAPLKIGDRFYNCSFTILDQQNVDFLFGLDMLKRHQEIPASERSEPTPPTEASAMPPPAPAASSSRETQEQKIQQLTALGFDAQRAAAALASTNGNVDLAAGLLFESM